MGSRHTGDLRGAEAVVAMIPAARKRTAGTFRLTPVQVVAEGEPAVALVRWSARKNGTVIDGREVAVYRIRSGRTVEASFHQDDPEKDREFWS